MVAASCGGGGGVDPRATGAPRPCDEGGPLSVGEALPDCTFEGMFEGPDVSLRALRGKPAVINFWAEWCTYCRREMPDLQRVHEALGERVTFVGLDFLGGFNQETRPAAERFAREKGVRYRLAYDPDGAFYGRFCACPVRPLMPLTVFADAGGVVRERHFGPLTDRDLRRRIRDLFGVE